VTPDSEKRALAVMAHPDDVDFGAAGTVARWTDEGWDVRYVIVTSGQKGGRDPRGDPGDYGALREAEQRAAAAAVGVTDVRFLGYVDSELVDSPQLRRDVAREFRRARPHRLLAMDAGLVLTDTFVNHPDHRVVGTVTLDTTVTGGTTGAIFPELVLEEGLEPWDGLHEIWIAGPAGGETVVDVSATVERKWKALEAHASQLGEIDVRALIGPGLAETGRPHGYDYAESFRVLRVG
jgi:LmbE family N-acetylglucosaminyl deacetylase